MIKILLVDDQALLCEVLQTRLEVEKDFEVIGRAYNGETAIEEAKRLQPDIILLDIEMPKMDGLTAAEIIKKNNPYAKIIILTGYKDESYLKKALAAGASSYLPKDTSAEDLKNTIRSVYNQDSQINSQALYDLQDQLVEIKSKIDDKWSLVETEINQIKEAVQNSIQTIFNAEAQASKTFKQLESKIESRWNHLQSDITNLEDETRGIMNNIDQAGEQYRKHLRSLEEIQMELDQTLDRLNQAGFNPANFKKIDKLQEQVNAYKAFVHEMRREESEFKRNFVFFLITTLLSLTVSCTALFLNLIS